MLGVAFLCVEVPLLQRFILYLGNPAYAFTSVLFALLFFSGLGSRLSHRLSLRLTLGLLIPLIVVMPLFLPWLFETTLSLTLVARLVITLASLAPLGFLMGVPFPAGLRLLAVGGESVAESGEIDSKQQGISWAWAVNGAASVVAPILAALLALSYGFRVVLWVGALFYLMALLTVMMSQHRAALRVQD
jgi:MFS family permease